MSETIDTRVAVLEQIAKTLSEIQAEMRIDMRATRTEMQDGFAALRAEMQAGFAELRKTDGELRTEMQNGFGDVRSTTVTLFSLSIVATLGLYAAIAGALFARHFGWL